MKRDRHGQSAVLIFLVCAIVALCAGVVSAQAPPPIKFVSGPLFSGVGYGDRIAGASGVVAMAAGDFNNDGKADIIATNSDVNTNGLGLMLGNGDGTFQAPMEVDGFDIYGGMGGIAAGDFNKDGNLDLAALWNLGGPIQVAVYLGDGHGGFSFNKAYSIGTTLTLGLTSADVSGDGNLDLIASDPSNLSVAVLKGAGDGTFLDPIGFPAGVSGVTAPTGVAVADLNGDGRADIVVASSSGCCPWSGGIGVLMNGGSGTFQPPVYYADPAGVDTGQVAIADLNGDGRADVVETSLAGNVAIFLGNGDGTFQTAINVSVPAPSAVAIGDLNGDKKPDLVVSSYYDGTVWVVLNKTSFQVSGVYSTDWSARSILLTDFNRDKKLDFVAGNSSGQFMTLALGNGDGTFRDSAHYNESVYPGYTTGFAVADFNKDGNLDLVQAGGGTGVGLSVMLGTSHGVFKTPTYINIGGSSYSPVQFVLAGDVSSDGKADIVCSTAEGYGNPYGVAVMLGKGNGTFNTPVVYTTSTSSYPATAVLVDLNRDFKPDIVMSNFDGSVSILLNTGKGVYGSATVIPTVTGTNPAALVSGDFNGDRKVDIALTDYQRTKVVLLFGNGNGTFAAPVEITPPIRPNVPIPGDFNKDGKLDLAITSTDFGGSMVISSGNGNGTFTAGPIYYFYPQDGIHQGQFLPNTATVVDLNGDGNPDIAIAPGPTAYQVCGGYRCAEQYMGALVFLGKGDGSFVQQSGWLAGVYPAYVAAGDFNSDGMPDLAYVSNNLNYGQTSVTVLQNATQPVSVSPLSIKYPVTTIGTGSGQTIFFTNDQTAALMIGTISLGGSNPADFSFKSSCGTRLLAGGRCTISVTFTPTVVGTRTATLSIPAMGVAVQTVQLTGTGK